MNRFTLICAALVFLLAGSVSAQDVLFRNATVLTITDGDLENTDVLVSGGIITEIGSNIRAPMRQENT